MYTLLNLPFLTDGEIPPYLLLFLFSHQVVSDSLQPHELQPAFPVLHYLSELAQTHVHSVGDGIQPPHHLSPPSLPHYFSSLCGLLGFSPGFCYLRIILATSWILLLRVLEAKLCVHLHMHICVCVCAHVCSREWEGPNLINQKYCQSNEDVAKSKNPNR